jgi:N-acetylneuraminic acid mutarotase
LKRLRAGSPVSDALLTSVVGFFTPATAKIGFLISRLRPQRARILASSVALLSMLMLPTAAGAAGNSWTPVASMLTGRAAPAATGPDGRIYVFGGDGGSGVGALDSTEAYSTLTNSWVPLAPMPNFSELTAASTGLDGRIYVFGGEGRSGIVSTVEAYDPSTNSWALRAPMPTARVLLATVTGPDGRIYAFGGQNGSGALNTVEAYSPSTNSWTTLAPMPTARIAPAAAMGSDRQIYVMGGGNGTVLSTVEAYNPGTNSWTVIAPMPTARNLLATATGSDGRIYAFGGQTGSGRFLNTTEAYNISTNSWESLAPMPTARENPSAAVGPDGRLYVIGGYNGNALKTVEAYSIAVADTTPPVIRATVVPLANIAGWNNSDVTVTWTVADAESGVASSIGCNTTTVSNETPGTTLACSATNGAGLSSSQTATIKIDKTPPVVSCSASPSALWPPNGKLVPVHVTVSVTDPGGSGPNGYKLVSITSNEGNISAEQQGFVIGTASTSGKLLADRNGKGTGRVYTLTYQGSDVAGNTATCTTTFRVSHEQGH